MAALLDSHSNSSTITSTYTGEVADEYEANYMTKEGASLKYAASMMLTAIDHIARYPSVAQGRRLPAAHRDASGHALSTLL